MKVKLAVLGGSFDPVHLGHLFLADEVLTKLFYDRIILVPAFQSPFKIAADGLSSRTSSPKRASARDRLDMLAASISGDPRLTIDDCEIRREGVSYTIDTLKDIIKRYEPEGKLGLIIGDDLASTFDKWRSPDEIAELTDIIIARRQPSISAEQSFISFPYPQISLSNDVINAASHRIRERINQGEAWRYLVPAGARYVIEDRKLYGFECSQNMETGQDKIPDERYVTTETIVRLENEVRLSLDFNKFMHSRNTALLAWDLCRRFGLDPQMGYLAGITHDLCKNVSKEELVRLANKDGRAISKLEQKKPGLLHARAAAVLLATKYGITDRDILDAVRYHTTGNWDMNSLAKVVYIADKIEISRNEVDPVLREIGKTGDLETIFQAVLGNTLRHLKSRQLDISFSTRKLLLAMEKKNKS